MSGGHFDYDQYKIQYISDEVEHLIHSNNSEEVNEYGEKLGYHYTYNTIAEFYNAVYALKKAQIYAQRIDWLVSGDDGEDTFHARLGEELVALEKWFKEFTKRGD